MSSKGFDQLSVRKETKRLVLKDCLVEFRRQNPEYEDKYKTKMTHDFMVDRLARYYLGERW